MKLNQLEQDIRLMEETISRMQSITHNVSKMDDQMDGVRRDLEETRA